MRSIITVITCCVCSYAEEQEGDLLPAGWSGTFRENGEFWACPNCAEKFREHIGQATKSGPKFRTTKILTRCDAPGCGKISGQDKHSQQIGGGYQLAGWIMGIQRVPTSTTDNVNSLLKMGNDGWDVCSAKCGGRLIERILAEEGQQVF